MAVEEEVNIALGSDQFPFEPNYGTTATICEAEYYLEAGMTPLAALEAVTIQPARMLEIDGQTGWLSVGKFADIVAVEGNPLEDFHALRSLGRFRDGGRSGMAGFIKGVQRSQTVLFPMRLEDWIGEDDLVRIIDLFVDELDLSDLGFVRSTSARTGRPGYHPAILLKLFIYGYLNRIPSSRRLEREAGRKCG